jgi:hypothetical protein
MSGERNFVFHDGLDTSYSSERRAFVLRRHHAEKAAEKAKAAGNEPPDDERSFAFLNDDGHLVRTKVDNIDLFDPFHNFDTTLEPKDEFLLRSCTMLPDLHRLQPLSHNQISHTA